MSLLGVLTDASLTAAQRMRYFQDKRLSKACEACGHPGYMHEYADRQYESGFYGVFTFEAGDIECEAKGCCCSWYEGDNYAER